MREKDSVAAYFVQAMLHGIGDDPQRVRAVLEQAGIDPAVIRQPMARVPANAFAALWLIQIRELNDKAEIAECRHTPRHFQDVFTGERKPLDFLRGRKVAALSGIAAPRGFEETIQRLGGELVHRKRFADHHRYAQQEILDMINASRDRGAEAIVTTEKDAVRFPWIERRDVPIYFLRVEIELLSGEEDFNALISRICFK